jgi:hypothetical protein
MTPSHLDCVKQHPQRPLDRGIAGQQAGAYGSQFFAG